MTYETAFLFCQGLPGKSYFVRSYLANVAFSSRTS